MFKSTSWAVVVGAVLCAAMTANASPADAPATEKSSPAFELVKNGEAAAMIVRPAAAPAALDKDIAAFNETLKTLTGAVLPVKNASAPGENAIEFVFEPRTYETEDAFAISFPADRVMRIACGATSVLHEAPHAAPPSRAVWCGQLKLGTLCVPVKAYPAIATPPEIPLRQFQAVCLTGVMLFTSCFPPLPACSNCTGRTA